MILNYSASCQEKPESDRSDKAMDAETPVFVTFVDYEEALQDAFRLATSIRTFGGKFRDAPIWIYHPEDVDFTNEEVIRQLDSVGAAIRTISTPDQAKGFFYGGKPYAAAEAEAAAAADKIPILIFTDADAIILAEPSDLYFEPNKSLAYRPVMHNRAGSLYDKPADAFWSRIYELSSIPEDMLFPMTTQADRQEIRAYFHCGLLSVRPEKGILRRWAEDFSMLAQDSAIVAMCRKDIDKRIFLHQNALTGAVLNTIPREETIELSERYNYPIFFEKQYGALEPFNSIEDVVTIRCVVSLKSMGPDWHEQLKGPRDKIEWLRKCFSEK